MVYQLVDARHGRFLVNENDTYVGRSLRLYGEWSEPEIWLFRQIARPGDVVIEAGANIGSHTVFLSKAVGDTGTVYAFEAARHTHQLLCANLALNECFNVHARHQAVGDVAGNARFPQLNPKLAGNFGGASMRDALHATDETTESVAMINLDGLDLPRVNFIKSDVEGFEPQVLAGARRTLEKHRPIVYLEIDFANGQSSGNRDALVELLGACGYAAYYFIAPMFSADNFKGHGDDVFRASSIDLICVPEDRASLHGLTRAEVGDTAIGMSPDRTSLIYAALPWSGARIERADH